MSRDYWVVCTPGLEEPMLDELREIGARKLRAGTGGCAFDGTYKISYRSQMFMRCADRVYLRVDEYRARDFPELYNKARRIDWERWLEPGCAMEFRGSASESRLIHTDRIATTIEDAIHDRFVEDVGIEPPRRSGGEEAQRVMVRVHDDRATVNLDMSGALMHRRGWRRSAVAAPLRESRAAALLTMLGWEGRAPLLDPMCGSGTFPIEAAAMAADCAPGLAREAAGVGWSFHRWANFKPELWERIRGKAEQRCDRNATPPIYGFDREPAHLEAAQNNGEAAGFGEAITWGVSGVSELEPPGDADASGGGFVVCNPPYGVRLEADAGTERPAHEVLVERFSELFEGWTLGLLLPAELRPEDAGLEFEELASFRNGGISVRWWRGRHISEIR